MVSNFSNAGPQVGQVVLYNNSGTKVPALIYSVNASTWVVSLIFFNASGTNNAASISYDPGFGSGKWAYPAFI